MNKLQTLKNKLKELQDELDKADDSNNPHKANMIRLEILVIVKEIEREERNQRMSPEKANTLFAKLRKDAGLTEIVKYRQFFDF